MAVTKLSLYNNALLLVGERKLATETDDVPSRYELDTAYSDPSAAAYCLELVKPKFALKTVKLTSPTTPVEHGLAYEYAFPSDYITIHSVFSDAELNDELHRYIIEDRAIACDNPTNIWLRYITDSRDLANWTPSFANVVAAYLGKQIAPRFAPQKLVVLETLFVNRIDASVRMEGVKEHAPRPHSSVATISPEWRRVYNNAFFILGLDEITSDNDDSHRRVKADVVVSNGLVETVLEDTGWTFGLTSSKLDYDPSLEPEWGYNRVFEKPIDMHRIHGVFSDSHFLFPLKDYVDEGDYWYCGLDEIYIQYVKTEFIVNPSAWPQYFTNLIAATMATQLAPKLSPELIEHAMYTLQQAERAAESADAMRGPPQRIKSGSWTRSRASLRRNGAYNQRP